MWHDMAWHGQATGVPRQLCNMHSHAHAGPRSLVLLRDDNVRCAPLIHHTPHLHGWCKRHRPEDEGRRGEGGGRHWLQHASGATAAQGPVEACAGRRRRQWRCVAPRLGRLEPLAFPRQLLWSSMRRLTACDLPHSGWSPRATNQSRPPGMKQAWPRRTGMFPSKGGSCGRAGRAGRHAGPALR